MSSSPPRQLAPANCRKKNVTRLPFIWKRYSYTIVQIWLWDNTQFFFRLLTITTLSSRFRLFQWLLFFVMFFKENFIEGVMQQTDVVIQTLWHLEVWKEICIVPAGHWRKYQLAAAASWGTEKNQQEQQDNQPSVTNRQHRIRKAIEA